MREMGYAQAVRLFRRISGLAPRLSDLSPHPRPLFRWNAWSENQFVLRVCVCRWSVLRSEEKREANLIFEKEIMKSEMSGSFDEPMTGSALMCFYT